MKRAVVGSTTAFCLALSISAGAQDAVEIGTKQTMDIAVTRSVVNADGEPLGPPAQTIRYRLWRVKTADGWETTMTLGAPNGTSREEIARNPFFGGRVEIDASGVLALFDNAGRAIPIPDAMRIAAIPAFSGDWSAALDGVSTAARSRRARIEEVEAKYGHRAGNVRGLAQYLRRAGEDIEELLFDEVRAVPVELNVVRGDVLHAHVAFDYVERGRGLLRRRIQSETIVNDEGHRAITATEFSPVAGEG
jgi:hypothetical protein